MGKTGIVGLALAVSFAVSATGAFAEEPKQENKLIGTWKLVSATYGGQQSKLPEGYTQVKHVTPVEFMWAWYDKDGKVTSALGGSYTLRGDAYEEVPEYGVGEKLLKALKGKPQSFTWKIEGNKWHHTGKLSSGQTIEEVWERVEEK
jgi:hypothetical protein